MQYWVIGGKYKNTEFDSLKDGHQLEKYGPYNTFELAKEKWSVLSWENVDDCYIKYSVIKQN